MTLLSTIKRTSCEVLRNRCLRMAWAGPVVVGVASGVAAGHTFEAVGGWGSALSPGLFLGAGLGFYLVVLRRSSLIVTALYAATIVLANFVALWGGANLPGSIFFEWLDEIGVLTDSVWFIAAFSIYATGIAVATAIWFQAFRRVWLILGLAGIGSFTFSTLIVLDEYIMDLDLIGQFLIFSCPYGSMAAVIGYGFTLSKSAPN